MIASMMVVVMAAFRIVAVVTGAEIRARHACLVTLTVVLKAFSLATIAALEVMLRGSSRRRSHHFLLLEVVALLAV